MKLKSKLLPAAVAVTVLSACGGGGGGSNPAPTANSPAPAPAPTATQVQGVVAIGAPLAGATITIKDASGATRTAIAAADGSYSFDVSQLTAPFVISAKTDVGDTVLDLTSIVSDKPASGATTIANVTPLTNAVAALLAPSGVPEELSNTSVLNAAVTKAKLDDAALKVRNAVESVLTEAGVDASKFNVISSAFSANRAGADRVLELVRVELNGKGVSLTSRAVADDGQGSASVQIDTTTAASAVAKLSAPPAGTTLGELDHIASLFEACFSAAPDVRVTSTNASGTPVSLSPACNAIPFSTTYKSGGYTGMQRYGGILKNADFTGAKFSKPEIQISTSDTRVFFKMAFRAASGEGGILTDVAEKTSPAGKSYKWEIVGNGRDYDSAVDVRLENITQLNSATVGEYAKSQYQVALRLYFDPSANGGRNVQMVRVKGPGLPASGVTMHRSTLCGTEDYMTISNKTGALVNSSGATVLWNGSSGTSFKLAAEAKTGTLDWTKLATSASYRETAMTDAELAAIPNSAEYTWELWNFGPGFAARTGLTNATPPDVVYKQRLSSRVPAISSLKSMAWNTIDTSDFLNPASALSATQASAVVNWKEVSERVDYAYAFGQRNTVTGTPAVFGTTRAAADSSATGVKLTARSYTVTPSTERPGTISLFGISGSTPPIPSCAATSYPSIDAIPGTTSAVGASGVSRSLMVRSRAYSLARKYVTVNYTTFVE